MPPRMSWMDTQLEDHRGSTPTRPPRLDEAMAAYSSEKRSSGMKYRSPSRTTENNDIARRITKPVLTQNRVDHHFKTQSKVDTLVYASAEKSYDGTKEGCSSLSKPSSSCYDLNVDMVGASKIYSRTLVPPCWGLFSAGYMYT